MKNLTKRCLVLLTVLVLLVSLLPGITLTADAATVTYRKTSDGTVYNWGKRGDTATFLSPMAEDFYADNNVTYAQLAALSGSTSNSNVPYSSLYKKLHDLMESNHDYETSYNATKDLYKYTDCQESGQGSTGSKISSYYSGMSIGPSWDGAWNREHTWPNSKGKAGNDENDLMMLRPTSTSENSSRGNKAYGTSSGYYNPNSESNNKYDLRGDVVRTALGHYVRWEMYGYTYNGSTFSLFGTNGMLESKALMLEWLKADPVDTWEMGRNDSAESILGYRNVFIDYPELAFILFGEEVPEHTTPSGQAMASAYTITAVSNNTSYGTVSLSGKTITAFPKTGYAVDGYTVTAGTATVTRSGDTFTVSASTNCTVRINFKAKTAAYGQFYENGIATTKLSSYVGDAINLPSATKQAPAGFTFQGWVTSAVEETSTKPAFYDVGSRYVLDATTNFYALYSRVVEDTTGTSNVFELYTGTITEGDYLLVYNYGAMQAYVKDNRLFYVGVSPADDAILSPAEDLIWTLKKTADGYYTLYNASAKGYAGATGTANQAGLLSAVTNYAKWTVSGTKTYDFANLGNQGKAINHTLRRNQNFGFACYSTSTGGALTLYKRASGTVLYSTAATTCKHENTRVVEAVAPDCVNPGYTEGLFCTDCSNYVLGHEVLEALKHNYKSVVTAPTVTQQGYTTHTCTRCGDSYVDTYVPALGQSYTVSFAVPTGVAPLRSMSCNNSGITLPEPGTPSAEYTFVGWATGAVKDETKEPVVKKAGSTYTTAADITLYAVYSHVVGGTGGASYRLVENVSQLEIGASVIIAAAEYDYAISTNQKSNNRGAAAITKNTQNKTATFGTDTAVFTLKAGSKSGTYSFYDAAKDGYLYAASSSSNYLRTQSDLSDNASFAITIAGGVTKVVAQGSSSRNTLQYNNGDASNLLFSCYSSASQKAVCLYVLSGSEGVTHYTTLDGKVGSFEKVGDGESVYASLQAAIAETGMDYLFLLEDLTEDVVVDSNIVLDLNGKTLTGDITVLAGAQLMLFDSATADYTADNRGKIVGSITGDLARTMNTPESYGHNYKYLTIRESDGSYSAHRIYLTVKSATLVPYVKGEDHTGTAVSYQTVFKCNDVVAQYVTAYGTKFAGNTAVYANYMADGSYELTGENLGTAWLTSTMKTTNTTAVNAANAVAAPTVRAYITLNDGLAAEVTSAGVTRSLKDMIVYANGLTGLTAVEKAALGTMYKLFRDVLDTWTDVDISAIKQYGA